MYVIFKEESMMDGLWNEIARQWGMKAVEFFFFFYGLGMYHIPGRGRDRF